MPCAAGFFRPIGMPAVAWLLLQFSHAEAVLRIFGLLGLASMTRLFVHKLYGAPAAFIAAAALVGGRPRCCGGPPSS